MGLFDMTDGSLVPVEPTSFADEGVLERTHLQAALRDNIELLGDDLLVVSEEFGSFQDAHRRIDLLCIDPDARPVVVELKRNNDGGHMELQALRYAAMISAMTFDDLVSTFERHLGRMETEGSFEARSQLVDWLDGTEGEDPVIRRDVRIILASADFSKEIMTTALWLNDVFGMDIRCVRLKPYRVKGRLLLNVEQVIPLPKTRQRRCYRSLSHPQIETDPSHRGSFFRLGQRCQGLVSFGPTDPVGVGEGLTCGAAPRRGSGPKSVGAEGRLGVNEIRSRR
jgi:hypothetical protein